MYQFVTQMGTTKLRTEQQIVVSLANIRDRVHLFCFIRCEGFRAAKHMEKHGAWYPTLLLVFVRAVSHTNDNILLHDHIKIFFSFSALCNEKFFV